MRPLPSSALARYGAVAPIVAGVVALQYAVLPEPDRLPYVLSLAGVALAAWVGGSGPGILAASVTTVLSNVYFMRPAGAFSTSPAALRATAVCLASGIGVVAVCSGFRRAVLRTQRANEELRRLQRRAERHVRLSEYSPLIVRDVEGRILAWNKGNERLYGIAAQDAIGRRTHDVLRTEFPQPIEEILDALRRRGEWQGELHQVRATGERLAIASTWMLHQDEEGEVILEFNTDLSGLRRAEAERMRLAGRVEEEQQVLRTVLATLPVGVFLLNREGAILASNREAERIWGGVVAADGVGEYRQYRGWHHASGRPVEPEDWPAARALATERPVAPELYDIEAFDGQRRTIMLAAVPLRGLDGTLRGAVAVVQDVTELTAADRELRRSRESLADAQRIGHIGSFEIDLVSGRMTWSEEGYRILGLDPAAPPPSLDELYGMVHEDDRAAARESLARVTSGRGDGEVRYRLRRPDGELRTLLRRARLDVNEHTGERRVVGIVQDITEQAELEQRILRAEKLESLSVLAGGVAHDFNNLLTGILGHAELALFDAGGNPQVRAALESILSSATRAAELAHQMLAYSGRAQVAVEPVDLRRLLEETVALARSGIAKGVDVQIEAAPGLPEATVDPTQVRQVVMNLLVNAAEATGEAGGVVTVRVDPVRIDPDEERAPEGTPLPPGDYVRLEVEDHGHGMDDATRSRVFEPFFSTKFPGRGLGMAAVQGIVRGHGGTIHIRSRPGAGTTVCVLLPVSGREIVAQAAARAGAVSDAAVRRGAAPAADAAALGRPCVLVVDDEEPVRSAMRKFLERKGFRVLTAVDGEQGVELLRAHGGDIRAVVLDLTMPRKSGADALRELRAVRADLPVLVTSGYAEQDALARVGEERHHIAGFVPKPLDFGELERRLYRLCERRRHPPARDH